MKAYRIFSRPHWPIIFYKDIRSTRCLTLKAAGDGDRWAQARQRTPRAGNRARELRPRSSQDPGGYHRRAPATDNFARLRTTSTSREKACRGLVHRRWLPGRDCIANRDRRRGHATVVTGKNSPRPDRALANAVSAPGDADDV